MIFVQQRIAQCVVLVGEFNRRRVENNAFFHAVMLGKGTRGNIADNHFQRNDTDLLDQRLPLAQFFNKMCGNALALQHPHQRVAHPVVDHALAPDRAFFQAVECRRVVLVVNDQLFRIIRCEYFLGFSLVQLFTLGHG